MKHKWSFSPEINKKIEATLQEGERLRKLCDDAEHKYVIKRNIMEIEQVVNGFIINHRGTKSIYGTIDEVFEHMLLMFENRSKDLSNESYGRVYIQREK